MNFSYTESEALEMVKTHFPKTWEDEIKEGQIFIKSMMHMYNLNATDAYAKYLRYCGSHEKAISTLAALHCMNIQSKIGAEIKEIQKNQLQYGNQITALDASEITSYEDKRILRKHYLSKQAELQQRIDTLIFDYPIIGAKKIIVQTNIFGD